MAESIDDVRAVPEGTSGLDIELLAMLDRLATVEPTGGFKVPAGSETLRMSFEEWDSSRVLVVANVGEIGERSPLRVADSGARKSVV